MSAGKIRPGNLTVPTPPPDTSTTSNQNIPSPAPTPGNAVKFAQEAQDTFTSLQADVKSGSLSAADAQTLSNAAGEEGVLGEAEAVRAAKAAEALSPSDRATFNGLVSNASSPEEKAFIYKALGAGYDVSDVSQFANTIHGWSPDKLIDTLNLADDTGADDGIQNGVKQQFDASCTATTAQAVRGEMDPIYALQVRTQNTNINAADDTNADAINPNLAAEQRHLLTEVGDGKATNRNDESGYGTWKVPEELASESAHTGFDYSRVQITPCTDPTQLTNAMNAIASQVSQGIPTPLIVGAPPDPAGHCILAMAVEGSGADQQFLIHDPWEGTTRWLSSADILNGNVNVAGWSNLGYYYQASPAPLASDTPAPAPAPNPAPVPPSTPSAVA